MIGFFLQRVRGPWVLIAAIVAYAYGFWALNIAPQWNAISAAQGGVDIQARQFVSPAQVAAALAQIDRAGLRATALQFYALDFPNFTLLGMGGAALMAFGVRRLGLAATPARWLIALPLLAAAADAVETASLALCYLIGPAGFVDVAAIAITTKRLLAMVTAPLALLLSLAGLLWWLLRLIRPSARPTDV